MEEREARRVRHRCQSGTALPAPHPECGVLRVTGRVLLLLGASGRSTVPGIQQALDNYWNIGQEPERLPLTLWKKSSLILWLE